MSSMRTTTTAAGAVPAARGAPDDRTAVALPGSPFPLGATPGQLLMGLRVTDAKAGGIGFFRAVLRYLVYVILGVLAPVSAIMVAVSKNKRALHDIFAGTYVIQVVDRSDLMGESGLPAAFAGSAASASAPATR